MHKITALLIALTSVSWAATTPVQVSDTIYNPDGSKATCTIYITNPAFVDSTSTFVPANSIQTQVTNGIVSVSLVPTQNAQTPAIFYSIQYSCANGPPQGSTREFWSIPPTGPVTIAAVRFAPFLTTGGINSINGDTSRTQTFTTQNDLNVTLNYTNNLLGNHLLTAGWTGVLGVNRGGTGAGTLTGLIKGTGTTPFLPATSADVIALFSGCSGIMGLGADGNCHTYSGGGGGSINDVTVSSPITGGGSTSTVNIACGTCGVTGSPLSQFANTTSSQLRGIMTDPTGTGGLVFSISPTLNLTSSTTFDLPAGAGAVATNTLNLTLDSTATNLHAWIGAADSIVAAIASAPTTGNCAQWAVSGGNVLLTDSGNPCGTGSGTSHQAALDCSLTYTDGTHLHIFNGASSTNFCSVGNNNGLVTKFTGQIVITQSGSTSPTLLVYVSDGSDGQTAGTAVVCNSLSGSIAVTGSGSALRNSCSSYPVSGGIYKIGQWTSTTPGSFDATGTVYRPLMSAGAQLIAGAGITITNATTGTTIALGSPVPVANGGTGTASTLVGLVRGNSSAMTAAELSGDATTSGSNVVTVTKINNTSFAGTNGHLVSFGAANIPADSGLVGANVVLAASPGLGVAHFAGATQSVTSSLIVAADITAATITGTQLAAVQTRRVCDMAVGDTSGSAISNSQLGPQSRICFIPAAATIVEMDVNADAGTPNVIVGRNRAGSIVNIVSGALATAASGGIACSNTGGTTGINGATTCSGTLQNTGLNAGDYLELVSGTAGGTAKFFVVHVIYNVS